MAGAIDARFVADVAGIVAILWAALVIWHVPLEEQQRIFDILSKAGTLVALIVGGAWSFKRFVLERAHQPRLNVDYELFAIRLNDVRWLLKVAVKLVNIGSVRIELKKWRLRAEQLVPCDDAATTRFDERAVFTEYESEWRTIAGEPEEYLDAIAKHPIRLEPGETDYAMANVVVPAVAQIIQLYSEFKEEDTSQATWVRQHILDLGKLAAEAGYERETTTGWTFWKKRRRAKTP